VKGILHSYKSTFTCSPLLISSISILCNEVLDDKNFIQNANLFFGDLSQEHNENELVPTIKKCFCVQQALLVNATYAREVFLAV